MVVIVGEPFRDSFVRRYREVFSAFRARRSLSGRAVQELQEYFEFCWADRRNDVAAREIMASLPPALHGRLALALSRGLLTGETQALQAAALSMRDLVFTPGDVIWRVGDTVRGILFIVWGVVEVRGGDHARHAREKEAFGVDALLSGGCARETLLALSFVTAVELPAEDWVGRRLGLVHPWPGWSASRGISPSVSCDTSLAVG